MYYIYTLHIACFLPQNKNCFIAMGLGNQEKKLKGFTGCRFMHFTWRGYQRLTLIVSVKTSRSEHSIIL